MAPNEPINLIVLGVSKAFFVVIFGSGILATCPFTKHA